METVEGMYDKEGHNSEAVAVLDYYDKLTSFATANYYIYK